MCTHCVPRPKPAIGLSVAPHRPTHPAWLLDVRPKAQAEPVADADPWVVRPAGDDLLTHPGSLYHQRRATLLKLVGVHLARGDSRASIRAMAEAWAQRCTPPFDGQPNLEDHWRKHVDGLLRKDPPPEPGKEGSIPPAGVPEILPSFPPATEPPQGNILPSFPAPAAELAQVNILPSFPTAGGEQGGEEGLSAVKPPRSANAYYGLLGEMLRAVEAETEADPVGVLLGWLTCFGSCVGRGAWQVAGPDVHHPALYLGIVGETSDAKGMAWGLSKFIFAKADPIWAKLSVCNGVGSGQGLIERVRDESRTCKLNKKTGIVEEQVVRGAADKRCLLRLDELAVCFKLQRSDSSTLGETLLTAWGGEGLDVPNRSGNDLKATGYSIAVIGDTQPGTLRKLLENGKGVEQHNGWLNRFLWCRVRSTRDVPGGGNMGVLEPYLERLASALAFAKQAGEIQRDAEAEAL